MKITPHLTDDAVLAELGARLQHHRVQAGITQADLATSAGVSRSTVDRLERGHSVQLTSLIRVLRELNLLGALDALLPPAVATPMELLENKGKRKRARRTTAKHSDGWTWGDDK